MSHRGAGRHPPPLRRRLGAIGIATGEQHGELVREQLLLHRARPGCVIYDDRPRTCRELTLGSEHCLTARRRVGLSL